MRIGRYIVIVRTWVRDPLSMVCLPITVQRVMKAEDVRHRSQVAATQNSKIGLLRVAER